jgi:hypothetical protein
MSHQTWVLGRLPQTLQYKVGKKMANEQEHIPLTHTSEKQVAQDVPATDAAGKV